MANIIEFPLQKPPSGLKRVNKTTSIELTRTNQMDLFSQKSPETNIFVMPSSLSPFEQALMLDDRNDETAKEAYQNAVNQNDCAADAYCNLGILEYESGKTIKAID